MNKFPSIVPGDHELILRAVSFATVAHDGQRRKYTGEPYIVHPLTVAQMVASRTMDPHVIAAAVLHDVLEDTPVAPYELQDLFGSRVAEMVADLTDMFTHDNFPELNRAQRKQKERERFATTSAEVQLIKAYDMLDNTRSIVKYDSGFAMVYLNEKRLLLKVMTKVDPHVLLQLKGSL